MKKQITKKLLVFIIASMMFSVNYAQTQKLCPCNSRMQGHCVISNYPFPHWNCKGGYSPFRFASETDSEGSLFDILYSSNQFIISFSFEDERQLLVKVYDINGNLIDTLADKKFPAGENSIIWDPTNKKAGIYFIKLETSGFTENKKLLVLQ